jgi:glycosyltransferase involved in cell wall biosynthesis
MTAANPLVSVVLIFFNAEKFIGQAIESVLSQTYRNWELLLVDDGSTDASSVIAGRYAFESPDKIRYLQHPGHANRGAPASRNFGMSRACGELIALLDADDVWLPHKLERQVSILQENEAAAVVFGRPIYWFSWTGRAEDRLADVSPRPGLPLNRVAMPPEPLLHSYPLSAGSAPCPSDLLFRRSLFDQSLNFEESFHGPLQLYEDQVFLTKVYLQAPVYVADECWLLYRQHDTSCIATTRRVGAYDRVRQHYLDWLSKYLRTSGFIDPRVRKALRTARSSYDHPVRERVRTMTSRVRRLTHKALGRFLPEPLLSWMPESMRPGRNHPTPGRVLFGSLGRVTPISRSWGWDRGLPVDRYYIERFLEGYSDQIRGRALEVGDARYSPRFGGQRIEKLDILHVTEGNPEATLIGDLSTADHIPANSFDCIILTQTLQYVFDLPAAFRTLQRILKPGGVLLATVPGISRTEEEVDSPRFEHVERWKESRYWSFTRGSLARLACEHFPPEQVSVESYGNVWAATAFLYGLAAEELPAEALNTRDPAFPVLVTLAARKQAGPA